MQPPPLEPEIGSVFAGHRIEGLAGRGGMGVVFRATDLALDRPVALKLIAPDVASDPVFRARFEHECRAAAAIDHPHAVEVFHAGEEGGVLYVTMRFVEGIDLGALLVQESPLDAGRAVGLVAQVAGALDEAHRHGLVHRDVKPSNVLIARRERREHAFLTDFGLTKRKESDDGLTKPGFAMGTADYMAPEQARGGDVDGRADVYALACLLFKTLTGTAPFDRGSDLEKMLAHLNDPPPSLRDARPDLPGGLEDVVRRAMAKEREDRHASAGMLAREALAAVSGASVPPPGASASRGMRVVVAEDSMLLRVGVVHLLEAAGFDVVGQAGDADELLRHVRAQRPDVAITDIRMPPTHTDEGLRAARTIRSELPGTGVLVLSQYAEEAYAVDLLGESAEGVGYLLKDRVADPRGFADAVRQVGQGGSALDPEVVARMLNRRRAAGPLDALSARQRDVLSRMAEGHSNHAIAGELELSERAVERDVGTIFSKLDLPTGNEGHRRVLAVLTYLRA
ncbi:MAG: protein kinase domain-containing protein [Solirubrobacteraceae bacterium]